MILVPIFHFQLLPLEILCPIFHFIFSPYNLLTPNILIHDTTMKLHRARIMTCFVHCYSPIMQKSDWCMVDIQYLVNK